jgi:hypothetical protein
MKSSGGCWRHCGTLMQRWMVWRTKNLVFALAVENCVNSQFFALARRPGDELTELVALPNQSRQGFALPGTRARELRSAHTLWLDKRLGMPDLVES